MVNRAITQKAMLVLKDRFLVDKWLETPCESFQGKSPLEHCQSSVEGEKDVLNYLEKMVRSWA